MDANGLLPLDCFLCSLLSLWYVYAPDIFYLIIGRFRARGVMALILPIATRMSATSLHRTSVAHTWGFLTYFSLVVLAWDRSLGGWISDPYGMEVSFYWMGGLNVRGTSCRASVPPRGASCRTTPAHRRRLIVNFCEGQRSRG